MELSDVVEAMSMQLAQLSQLHLQVHLRAKELQRENEELKKRLAAPKIPA